MRLVGCVTLLGPATSLRRHQVPVVADVESSNKRDNTIFDACITAVTAGLSIQFFLHLYFLIIK